MSKTILHLRAESKALEHRSALTPTTAKALIDAGYVVNVESSPLRIFDDQDFLQAGANLLSEGSWPDTDHDNLIVGLKELPDHQSFPLKHTHIQFAHCYKGQAGWDHVLRRFQTGGGKLLDLEFLADSNGRRVAAFGYHAGFAGSALAVETWAWQLTHAPNELMKRVKPYNNEATLIDHITQCLHQGERISQRKPRVLVMGALGRCGRGAVELLEKIGVPQENILKVPIMSTTRC